jgi:hypothetical protein
VRRDQVGREIQVHQLAREPGRGPERGQLLPRARAVAGLLLELPPDGQLGILDRAVGRVDIERARRDLEQDPLGRCPPLANEEDPIVGVDRDDRDRTRMAGDVALGARPVGPFDRVDAELEIAAAMEDAPIDDALDELVVGRTSVRVGRWGVARRRSATIVDRAGRAGPIG